MSIKCTDCGADIEAPHDMIEGEIISCPICGLDYVAVVDGDKTLVLQELIIESEDWGE